MAFGKRAAGSVRPVRGMVPQERTNPALTATSMRAMDVAASDEMDALVAKVNAHIPGVAVLPWAIIPWAVWKDQNELQVCVARSRRTNRVGLNAGGGVGWLGPQWSFQVMGSGGFG